MVASAYARLGRAALRIIDKYGRPVTIKFVTDASPVDPTKPWDPAPPTIVVFPTIGVVSPADEAYVDHTTILKTDEQIIVPAQGMPHVPDPKSIVLDGAVQYKVLKVDGVDPGPVALVYTLFVRR